MDDEATDWLQSQECEVLMQNLCHSCNVKLSFLQEYEDNFVKNGYTNKQFIAGIKAKVSNKASG